MLSERRKFLAGIKAELPILIGVIPFGVIYGVVALEAGLKAWEAQAMSAIVFAGSAQFVTAQLVGVGAPGLVIALTGGVINLRHALYSASVAPYVKPLRPAWKWLLSYLLTDEAYAVTITHYHCNTIANPHEKDFGEASTIRHEHWYFLGAGLALWATWQVSTAVGIFLGAVIPESWSLDFTVALTFIALVVPVLRDRASLAAGAVAGLVAVLAVSFPLKLGLVIATVAGIAIGLWMEAEV
ncbi:MAG TPA: AzlC family ABC transporter permease [Anaerolineales bacterium]|jgi:predicted branched-subunit amino acid permease|nr:AzlC family ABC transporter permease [Anaerolineales bacterium]